MEMDIDTDDYLCGMPGAWPSTPPPSATSNPPTPPPPSIPPKPVRDYLNSLPRPLPPPPSTSAENSVLSIFKQERRHVPKKTRNDNHVERPNVGMPGAFPRPIKKPTSKLQSISSAIRLATTRCAQKTQDFAERIQRVPSSLNPVAFRSRNKPLGLNFSLDSSSSRKRPLEEERQDEHSDDEHWVADNNVPEVLQLQEDRHVRRKFAKYGRSLHDTAKAGSIPLMFHGNPRDSVYINHTRVPRTNPGSDVKESAVRRDLSRAARNKPSGGSGSQSSEQSPIVAPLSQLQRHNTSPSNSGDEQSEDLTKPITAHQSVKDLIKDVEKVHIQEPDKSSSDDETLLPVQRPPQDEVKSRLPEYEVHIRPSRFRQSIESKKKIVSSETRQAFSRAAQEAASQAKTAAAEKERLAYALEQAKLLSQSIEEDLVEKEPKKRLLIDLSDEWESRLDDIQSLAKPNVEVTTTLNRHDFGTLIPSTSADGVGWLNDMIIAEYLDHVAKKGRQESTASKDEGPIYHAFNSHLYTKWAKTKEYQDIARWIKRAKLDGTKLLNTEMVFIPIHDRSHWTLVVVSGKDKTIKYFDSLGGSGKAYTAFALDLIAGTLGSEFKEDEWIVQVGKSTDQTNGLDCGVFVCMNTLALMKRLNPSEALSADDIPAARRQIAATLVNGGFTGDFDFQPGNHEREQ